MRVTQCAVMIPRRCELLDFEWSIIQPLLPNTYPGVRRADGPQGPEWHLLEASDGLSPV
jgi:hypothetical protein